MANNRIEMYNLKHLIRLKYQGHSNRKIAIALGINRSTVNEYVQFFNQLDQSYEQLNQLSELQLSALFPKREKKAVEKYKALSLQFSDYEKELQRTGATYLNLWEEYRQAHADGYSYNQFKTHLKNYINRQSVSMRIEHKYGDQLFIDYSGKKLHIVDKASGQKQEVQVFVAILAASQYCYVEASATQQLDDFLHSLNNTLSYLGGVPKAIVSDNLKSAVTKADPYEPNINRHFQAFAQHYETALLPTRAYKPKDKALVEGMVKIVYQKIFFPLRHQTFFSLAQLNQAIREQLQLLNTKNFKGRNYSRQTRFEAEEIPLLSPLPQARFERKIYRKSKVNKDSHLYFGPDQHYYSVPYAYLGKEVQVQADKNTLDVYYNYRRIALHQRSNKAGGFTTIPEHLPANIRFVKDWSEEQFTQKAQQIGQPLFEYFRKIYQHKKHPQQAHKSCMGILALAKIYTPQRINTSCERAEFYSNYSYQAINNILKKGIDLIPLPSTETSTASAIITEADANIRGAQYFN